jgi:ectoine hydroxylase-related dioxygenase (phytanoyl-CoA dioxygenase family)
VTSSLDEQVREEGWAVTPPVVPPEALDALTRELTTLVDASESRGGFRHLLEIPLVRALARSGSVRAVAEAVLGPDCFAVRGLLFDKTPDANWKVIWHQDLTIAVREKRDVRGFGPWTEKDGVPHVQPTMDVLERMVAVRVHLDDCGLDNGPVRVIAGSHLGGRLSAGAVDDWRKRGSMFDCVVPRGGILAFKPMLLHASSPATTPRHRRVVHLEFAFGELPGGLAWHHAV